MACGAPDLCPRSPGSVELRCLSCDAVAEASYAARCFTKERELQPEPGSPASDTFRKMEESEVGEISEVFVDSSGFFFFPPALVQAEFVDVN